MLKRLDTQLQLTLLTMVEMNCDRSYVHCEHCTSDVWLVIIKLRFQL